MAMHRAHTEGSAALSQVELQRHAQLLCPAHPLGAQPALRGGYRAGAMGGCVKTLLKHALLVRRVVAGARGVHYALGEAVAEGCAPRQRTGTAVAATLHAELRRREEEVEGGHEAEVLRGEQEEEAEEGEEEEEGEESLFRGQCRERGGLRARPRYPGVEDVIQSAVLRS